MRHDNALGWFEKLLAKTVYCVIISVVAVSEVVSSVFKKEKK